MSEKDEIQQVAQDFLDLWQKQLNSMTKSPDIMGQMLQTMQDMQKQFFEAQKNVAKTTGSALSQHGDDELLQLNERLGTCEKRLDALEQKAKK